MSTAYAAPYKVHMMESEEHIRWEGEGEYYVVRGETILRGFISFYEAYMYALNKFGSEDFLVRKRAGRDGPGGITPRL